MPPPERGGWVVANKADNDSSLVLKANQKEEENDPSR